jgi:cytochrome c553
MAIWISFILLVLGLAWGVAAQETTLTPEQVATNAYVQSCGTCHIALPAEVLPSESWRRLIQDPNHYGQQIELPPETVVQLMWSYLKDHARPLLERESIPYRLADSRYFKALHPQVSFPQPVRVTSCIDCHAKVELGDFITLTPEQDQ